MRPLTRKQEAFVREYLIDFNGTRAAIAAGYSENTATVSGSENLRKPNVMAAIEAATGEKKKRAQFKEADVLDELALLSGSDYDHYQVDENGKIHLAPGAPEGAMRAIGSVNKKPVFDREGNVHWHVTLRLWDKPQALTLIGRHLAMWKDKLEHSGEIRGGDLKDKTTEELEEMAKRLRGEDANS